MRKPGGRGGILRTVISRRTLASAWCAQSAQRRWISLRVKAELSDIPIQRVASLAKLTVWVLTRMLFSVSAFQRLFLCKESMASVLSISERAAQLSAHSKLAAAHLPRHPGSCPPGGTRHMQGRAFAACLYRAVPLRPAYTEPRLCGLLIQSHYILSR